VAALQGLHGGQHLPARSPPRRGQNSRRKTSQPGPLQVITLRSSYQLLVRDAIFAGGDPNEAEDAAASAHEDVYVR
jgi:hypothetical protein